MRTSHPLWIAPLIAGIAWFSIAAVQLSGHDFRGQYDAPIDFVRESVLMLAFTGSAASALVVSRVQDGRGAWAARGVTASAVAAVTAIAIGMASGEEPEWFFNVMGPALLVMAVSLPAMTARSWRAGAFPRWALVLIVLTPISVPAFWFGFSVIPAAGWFGIAWRMAPWRVGVPRSLEL